jgi:hypothetical protein
MSFVSRKRQTQTKSMHQRNEQKNAWQHEATPTRDHMTQVQEEVTAIQACKQIPKTHFMFGRGPYTLLSSTYTHANMPIYYHRDSHIRKSSTALSPAGPHLTQCAKSYVDVEIVPTCWIATIWSGLLIMPWCVGLQSTITRFMP